MEWGQQMEKHKKNALDSFYQNPNYSFERNQRKTLVIDSKKFSGNGSSVWAVKLFEPLIIDKLSDIYLESMITFNCNNNSSSVNCAFLLEIKEFNINTNIASNISGTSIANTQTFNKLLIPNENNSSDLTTIHKAKKLNYICSINPTKLSQLSGTITNINNRSIWKSSSTDRRFIAELVIISRNG